MLGSGITELGLVMFVPDSVEVVMVVYIGSCNRIIVMILGKYRYLSQERLIILVRSQLIYQRMLGFFN